MPPAPSPPPPEACTFGGCFLSSVEAPAGYPSKNSNNQKIQSAPRTLSFSFSLASLQHKKASVEERGAFLGNRSVSLSCASLTSHHAPKLESLPPGYDPINLGS